MVDSHVAIPEDVTQVVNNMGKQEVTSDGIQFRNIHHESNLSLLFVDDAFYDKDNCASDADWKIRKKPETDLKKIEFNIDKPETGLKKIDFNITTNNNEIDDMNDDEIVHPSDDLDNDMYHNIDH